MGVGSFTVLVTDRATCCGLVDVVAVLLAVTGSNWSAWVIVAVLTVEVSLVTCAWIRSVRAAAVSTVPTVQRPVTGSYVPWLGVADTKVRPAGRRSVTCTLVAESGPLSVSATV